MVGTISDRDIAIRAVAEGKSPDTKVRDVMSKGIHWAYDDDTIEHAAELMSKHQVRRLPIVNRDKRLVGIVALGDFAVDRSEIQPAAEALTARFRPRERTCVNVAEIIRNSDAGTLRGVGGGGSSR